MMCLVMSMSLSGCALTSLAGVLWAGGKIEEGLMDLESNALSKNVMETLAKDTGFAQSKDTYKAGQKLAKANEDLATAESGWNVFRVFDDNYCMWWNEKSQKAKLQAKLKKANSDYNNTKATDSIYQEALRDNGEKFDVDTFSFLPLIGIVIVVLVLIIILKPKRFRLRRAKQAPAPAPVVVQAPAPAPAQTYNTNTDHYDLTPDEYMKALSKLCASKGFDKDAILAQNGGDPEKAFMAANLM